MLLHHLLDQSTFTLHLNFFFGGGGGYIMFIVSELQLTSGSCNFVTQRQTTIIKSLRLNECTGGGDRDYNLNVF